jgi:aldehyde reductase
MEVPSLIMNSGHKIPQFGLGTWLSKPGEAGEAVRMALDVGYTHFDLAMAYGNQEEIGKVFKSVFDAGKIKREDLFITGKIWNSYHSFEKATFAIDSMLKELQIPYLDLCLIHWPMGYNEDGGMFPKDENGKIIYSDIDYLETWKAMEASVKAGKVRSLGISNFNTKQIQRIIDNSVIKPAMLQVECNPYFPQNAMLEFCKKRGIAFTCYSPLANNTNVFRKEGEPNLLEEKIILDLASKHHKTPAQIVLRWAIQRETVIIPKSIRRHRLEENIKIWDFKLSQEDMASIDKLDRNWRLLTLDRDNAHKHYPFNEAV